MSKKHRSSIDSSKKPAKIKKRGSQKATLEWVRFVLAAVIVIGGAFWISGSKGSQTAEPRISDEANSVAGTGSTAVVSPAEVYNKIQQGAFILDVRTQIEYDQYHIANSTLIPLTELKERVSELPHDRDIVVVCRSGNRSKQALSVLQQAGILQAESMAGGLNAWKKAGYPLEGADP